MTQNVVLLLFYVIASLDLAEVDLEENRYFAVTFCRN